jgi:hypothetical protein
MGVVSRKRESERAREQRSLGLDSLVVDRKRQIKQHEEWKTKFSLLIAVF